MGEAKRKRDRLSPVEQAALDLTHKLANEGKLIESGFAAYIEVRHNGGDTPGFALRVLRDAYMAGAEHLWSSIMATLDPGVEPTDADLRRMELIAAEIDAWREKITGEIAATMPTKGSA
jgi:hypothetical protein